MFNEMNCLENLKHIVSEHADDENMKNLSLDELRSSYMELADYLYPISVSNRLKYKNMLWNINNLKSKVRSDFQTQIFNAWRSIYIKSMKTDQIENHPDMKKQELTFVEKAEKSPDVHVKEQAYVFTEPQLFESDRQKRAALNEGSDLSRKEAPVKKQSHSAPSKASVHRFENDWFDKFLDFFASIAGSVSEIFGH